MFNGNICAWCEQSGTFTISSAFLPAIRPALERLSFIESPLRQCQNVRLLIGDLHWARLKQILCTSCKLFGFNFAAQEAMVPRKVKDGLAVTNVPEGKSNNSSPGWKACERDNALNRRSFVPEEPNDLSSPLSFQSRGLVHF